MEKKAAVYLNGPAVRRLLDEEASVASRAMKRSSTTSRGTSTRTLPTPWASSGLRRRC